MKNRKKFFTHAGRCAALLLCVVLLCTCLLPIAATAEEKGKTVRVGWYESPFNMIDAYGRRSGYAYEYQKKIAAYSGWNFEYVEGSWPELMQMLIDGEIDLMSDVSFTKERTESMLFSSLPMGEEVYYVFISPDNKEIDKDDLSTFNGKKVGINKGSVQVDFFREWEKANGVEAEIVEMTEDLEESISMLHRGDIDMYVVLDGYLSNSDAIPICEIGSSDFFFAVNRSRPDLLTELNTAMSRVQEENYTYQQRLYEKYFKSTGSNFYLSSSEKNWLDEHGTIRVGYQDDYMPYSSQDESTGELTGALSDYLADASKCFENAVLSFEPIAYPSAARGFEALKNGEIDCMFPCEISVSDGEAQGLDITPAIMTTEIYAVVREKDQHTILHKKQVTAAIEERDPNAIAIMKDHFPDWKYKDYSDIHACLDAVAEGNADCALINNYQYHFLAKECKKLRLSSVATGEYVDDCFAVRSGDTELFSILTRTTDLISKTGIIASLSYYSSDDEKTTLIDFIRENPVIDIAVVVMVLAFIIVIVAQQRIIRAKREVEESHLQVNDLHKRVYVDALTSVRNKGGFNDWIQEIQLRIDNAVQTEFAIVVLDCNDLKLINDRYGHDKGDIYLQTASQLICRVYKHSPVFRIGGDEFAAVLQNEDYQNRKELIEQFEKEAEQINSSAQNEWEKVNTAIGMADFDPKNDSSVDDVIHRADKHMYDNKRAWKEANPDR